MAQFKVNTFRQLSRFMNSTFAGKYILDLIPSEANPNKWTLHCDTECPYSAVISVVSCKENIYLYEHLKQSCPAPVLFTLFESVCQRPPTDMGIGIPHLNSVQNMIPMLADFGITLSDRWRQIIVLYDSPLGKWPSVFICKQYDDGTL